MTTALVDIELAQIPLFWRGKVRNSFDLGDERLLIVATDRISAFDVILPTAVPGKGALLNRLSCHWFRWMRLRQPNHFLSIDMTELPLSDDERHRLHGRSMIVRQAARIDVECIVRGYLAGSAWEEYRNAGTIHGEPLQSGLKKSDKLPTPHFTPALKRDTGHDENITRLELRQHVGAKLATALEVASLALYRAAARLATDAGFVLADTKFEYGFIDEQLTLIDEALTPDSSRYWDANVDEHDREPPSFDKQLVRDWLSRSGWNKQPPAPALPQDVVAQTLQRYQDVERRIRATMDVQREVKVDG